MLTVEMLNQNPALVSLSDSVKQAIAEMSKNDENTVIGTRIGQLHGQYDQDILSISGVAKNQGEKSYDYAKRVLSDYKAKIDGHKAVSDELAAAKATVADLQSKLEKGEDKAELTKQLKDAKAQVTQLQSLLSTKENEFKTEKAKLEAATKDIHIDYAFQAATAGLKFKDGITENVQKILLNAAKAEILAKGTPDFIDETNGSKKFVLRDSEGLTINNPKNNLNPYTLAELLMETSLKDSIQEDKQQKGGGTGAPKKTPSMGGTLDMAGVKTQVEADKLIESHLLANGLTRDSEEFADKLISLRNENNVSSLPIR